ncbi:MAG: CoA transferase [Methanobacteriota archaeon]|nr:MAG: CoA transferase [Euryarchaeota archaeon]|tara:strand:+ start:6471 stop:7499 length:1029 start_codon:yes stop_codon:yes gene_type:complete
MEKILNGVNVLDLSRILAGPYAGQMLADLGANVTKIEAPWGDDTRGWGPPYTTGFDQEKVAAYFLCCNRGKRIIKSNLKNNKEMIVDLMKNTDVIIENFKPGTLERLIGPIPEDIIVCSISGFGATGPRMDEPGYDLSLQARSGIMSITGESGNNPCKVGVAWIDVITGLNAGNAILAALYDKEKTGKIRQIDISLWDCAISALVNQAQNFLASGKNPKRMGTAHPNLVPYRAFESKDGWFVIAIGSDNQWIKFCNILEIESKADWKTNTGRIKNRDEIELLISKIVKNYNRLDLEKILTGIPCAPVNNIEEALNDPQSISRGVIKMIGEVPTLASPLRFIK